MAVIYFDDVVTRQTRDERPVIFTWPRSGASFTYTYSLDGGESWTGGTATIAEKPDDGDVAEYVIPYVAFERPDNHAAGTLIYNVSDGVDTAKIYVNVLSAGAAVIEPILPSGDQFTSPEEMERVFSSEGIDNHTYDFSDNTVVINEIIYRATETVLQFLRGRYVVSDMVGSYWVRMKATYIACYFLSIRMGNPSLYADVYAESMLDLAQARDGLINPGLKTPYRVVVQTPMMDSRFFNPARINPNRSTTVYSNQKLPYRLGNYE